MIQEAGLKDWIQGIRDKYDDYKESPHKKKLDDIMLQLELGSKFAIPDVRELEQKFSELKQIAVQFRSGEASEVDYKYALNNILSAIKNVQDKFTEVKPNGWSLNKALSEAEKMIYRQASSDRLAKYSQADTATMRQVDDAFFQIQRSLKRRMAKGGRLGQNEIDRHIRELRSIISKIINPGGLESNSPIAKEYKKPEKSEMAKEDPVQADIRMVSQHIKDIKNKIRKIYNIAVEAGYGQSFEYLATIDQSAEMPTIGDTPTVVDPRNFGSTENEDLSRGELTASDARRLMKAASFYDITGRHADADEMVVCASLLIQ